MASEQDVRNQLEQLDQQIRELEQSLALPLPEAARVLIAQSLQGAQEQRDALSGAQGTAQIQGPVMVGPVQAERDVYVATHLMVNSGTVQQFFGSRPPEDGVGLLDAYLDALGRECDLLRLSRLTGKRQTGAEQSTAPPLRLQAVYTSLTTDGPQVVLEQRNVTVAEVREALKQERTPSDVPPEQVRVIEVSGDHFPSAARSHSLTSLRNQVLLHTTPSDLPCTLSITRPRLAVETVAQTHRLVLLGEPGAGKSTVLRYLAVLQVQRLRGGSDPLPGWPEHDLPIPILCPLGRVAATLPEHGQNADKALDQVLLDLLEGEMGQYAGLRPHLQAALRGEGVLFLFDGLDELPADTSAGGISPRAAVAEAIRRLASKTRSRIVVTSRILPYHTPGDWKLPADEGWEVRTLAPLAFGQVQTFVHSWYTALAITGSDPDLNSERAHERAKALIGELERGSSLRSLIQSPLLLTMLAVLHYNTDEVPRDRARLYEECVQLLLERWEPVRTPGLKRPSLLERLGNLPGLELDLLRGVIHDLAFQAHDRPPGDDGRGLLNSDALHGRLLRLFSGVHSPNPARAVATFEQVLREDAGLLLARADGQYAFPHLTFQEYLAACHLADHPDMTKLVDRLWHSTDADRWREAFRLLIGRLRQQGKTQNQTLPWLQHLISSRLGKQPKPAELRRRDAVLAILVYNEIGEAALNNSLVDVEVQIEKPLREAIVYLLSEHDPAITITDRVQAGLLLGALGDPRFPVTLEEWRREIAKAHAGLTDGYFCRVEKGVYRISHLEFDEGGFPEEAPPRPITLTQTFWIARFPITNAQWLLWTTSGGKASVHNDLADWRYPNRPISGISWDDAVAFCAWLSTQLGVEVRLPQETEWEASARGPMGLVYPWGNEWSDDRAATQEDQRERLWEESVPVGCYPAGVSPCGALDMAGNIWEWMMEAWQSYQGTTESSREESHRVLRGGCYNESKELARCSIRLRAKRALSTIPEIGMRVVLVFNDPD